jgi:HD-GYP domain-containing protein (c-di-GMP phosphodiesterase class II)
MRKSGDDIPLGARIFAVVDTLDAMTSDRPYRKGLPYERARDELLRYAGKQFDPRIVQAFLEIPSDRWLDERRAVHEQVQRKQQNRLAIPSPSAEIGTAG